MIEVFYVLVVAGILLFHLRESERWSAERARLLAAIVAPTSSAAYAALTKAESAAEQGAPAKRDGKEPRSVPVPVGAE